MAQQRKNKNADIKRKVQQKEKELVQNGKMPFFLKKCM
jgi:hypothetical protein